MTAKNRMSVRALALLVTVLPMFSFTGCASTSFDLASLFGNNTEPARLPAIVEPRVHLGGEALAQKKQRMRRVHKDLVFLYEGYEVVSRQLKQEEQRRLEGFIRPYIDTHANPLISAKGEAWNTDLRALEANLLFAEAALYVAIDEQQQLEQVIDEIGDRFGGHESLLIEYPIGETQTLAHAIRDLRIAQASL